ncbi:MAG: MASE3 domain-containing protein [Fibrobacterota bacterium]
MLFWVGEYNFLLFHTAAEFFPIAIGFSAFIIAWHSRRISTNRLLVLIGISFMPVVVLDLLHLISYKGMGILSVDEEDVATQFWIAARYIQTFSIIFSLIIYKSEKVSFRSFLFIFTGLAVLLAVSIFTGFFPSCYSSENGLTVFKKVSEYILSILLVSVAYRIISLRIGSSGKFFRPFAASMVLMAFAEISFTFYISVYGLSNIAGHIFKLYSFYLLYICVVKNSLVYPYETLFSDLAKRNKELEKALSEVKTLSGLLPVCSVCRKVRDDKGYWDKIEAYITKNTGTKFSHSMCPECAREYYPFVFRKK